MRACILEAPGRIVLVDRPAPEPGPGEVRVRVRAALTCGTDLKTYRRGHPKIPLPAPLGHEYSGEIDAVGEGVTRFSPGQAVMGVHTAPCGACGPCARGRENLCESLMQRKVLGAFAEQILLPAEIVRRNLYPIPSGLSFRAAAFLEPLSCVVHGLSLLEGPPETALVVGAGPIGLLHVMLLALGGTRVYVAGRRRRRLETAVDLGARRAWDVREPRWAEELRDASGGRGMDAVIECTGSAEAWEEAPRHVRPGGTVVFFGGLPAGSRVRVDATRLHYDEIALRGAFHFTPADVRSARDRLAAGALPVERLVSDVFPLDRTAEAMARLDAGEGIKYCIEPVGEGG